MNNLYGAAMKQPLPYGEIERIDDKTIEKYNNTPQFDRLIDSLNS